MKTIAKLISSAFLGIGIGSTLNLVFSSFHGAYSPAVPSFLSQYDSLLTAMFLQTVVFAGLGVIPSYAGNLFANEQRGLLVNTILHFTLIFLPLLAAAWFLHWSTNLPGLLWMGLSMLLIYVIIWVVIYCNIRSTIAKINQAISEKAK